MLPTAAVELVLLAVDVCCPTSPVQMSKRVWAQFYNGVKLLAHLNLCLWPSLLVDPFPDLSS